jgi:nucleoside-diphosphate-sugar epimerase
VDEQEFYDVHVKAVELLCQSAVKNHLTKYLHCSTIGVLGTITDPPADENRLYNAVDIYQKSKAEGEKTALSYHGKEGLAVTVVRPAVVYGPGDKRMGKLFKMIAGKKFRMIGNGKTLTHPVYVDDLVTGMILACESKKAGGEIYILGGEKAVTITEWVDVIAKEAGVKLSSFHIPYRPLWFVSFLCEIICGVIKVEPPLFRRRVDYFVKDRAFTIEKAKRDLGYEPKIDLHEGARRTLAGLHCE